MVQLIPPESFWKRWKSSEVFLFSRSNRNDRKNPVPFVNSHSTRCTSASFPAIRRCRCSRHFDLLLFSSSRESLGLGETPHRENPVPLRAFHSNRIFRANGKRPWCIVLSFSFSFSLLSFLLFCRRPSRHLANLVDSKLKILTHTKNCNSEQKAAQNKFKINTQL